MRSKQGLYLLTDAELRLWLVRYRMDLRYDGECPPYGHATTKWARSLCGDIVRELVRRWADQRKKEPQQRSSVAADQIQSQTGASHDSRNR